MAQTKPSRGYNSLRATLSVAIFLLLSLQQLHAIPDECLLPVQRREDGSIPYTIWYYTNSTGLCTDTISWGTPEEGNQFLSEKECLEYCSASTVSVTPSPTPNALTPSEVCHLPKLNDLCREFMLPGLERFYFSPSAMDCMPFSYYGCGANANHFIAYDACISFCGTLMHPRTTPQPSPSHTSPSRLEHTVTMAIAETHSRHSTITITTQALTSSKLAPSSTLTAIQTSQQPSPSLPPSLSTSSSPPPPSPSPSSSLPPSLLPSLPPTPPTPSQPPATTAKGDTATGLSIFDYASITVGILVFSLLFILMVAVGSLVLRYQRTRHKKNLVFSHKQPLQYISTSPAKTIVV